MATVEELVLRARPEGIEQTSESFQNVEESVAEAGAEMGETTDNLEGLQQRWQGAMTALVGGLAVASAGLLSQIPVLQTAFGGLSAVVSAVAYQMDRVIRPIVQPLANAFFKLANAIMKMNGPAGKFVGIAGTIVTILAGLAGAIATVSALIPGLTAFGAVVSTFSSLAGILSTIIGIAAGAVSALAAFLGLPAIVVAGLIAAFTALLLNIGGVRDKVVGFFTDIATGLAKLTSNVATAAGRVAGNIASEFAGLVADGAIWASNFIGNLIAGLIREIQNVASAISMVVGEVSSAVEGAINKALQWGQELIADFVKGIRSGIDDVKKAAQDVADAADPRNWVDGPVVQGNFGGNFNLNAMGGGGGGEGNQSGRSAFANLQNQTTAIYIDGRKVAETQNRYSDDSTNRRGRF